VEWEIVRLSDLGQIVGGGTPSTKESEYWNGDIAWITPADLSGYTDKYIARGSRNITQSGLAASSAVVMPIGSVLMSSRAPIGYCVISANEVSTNQGFKSVVPYITATNEYLYYYLLANVEGICSRASGTTFKEISGTEFGNTVVSLPPLAEQLRIVSAIEAAYLILDIISSNIR
jgi:type I restriction enzyme S subunit